MRKKADNEFLSKKTITKVKSDDLVKQDRKKEHSLPMPTERSELNYKVENLMALVSQSIDKEFGKLKEIIRQAISLHQPELNKLNNLLDTVFKTSERIDALINHELIKKSINMSIPLINIEIKSYEAIEEHLKKLLSDERLLATPHNHKVMSEFYEQLFNQPISQLGKAVSSIKARDIAKNAGIKKVKKYGYAEQKEACRNYYLEHKNEYKNKADAAYAIEGKTINNVEISVSPRTIEKYLTGL